MFRFVFKVLISCALVASCQAGDNTSYQLKFGYVTTEDGKTFAFLYETNLVPLWPMSKGAYYGVKILPYHTKQYEVEIKVEMPDGQVFNFPSYRLLGEQVIPMGFDESDIEGEYVLFITINDVNIPPIVFEAHSPEKLLKQTNGTQID